MRLKILFCAFFASFGANALAAPEIIGVIPNKSGGVITFTTLRGDCPQGQLMVYTQSSGGKIELTGCFRVVSKQLFVIWADGDAYTYPVADVQFSEEFVDEAQRKKTSEKGI